MEHRIKILTFVFTVFVTMFFVHPAQAIQRGIDFSSPVGVVRTGDLISVDVLVTNLDQAMNAVDLTIHYPAAQLEMINISRAQSALQLWPEAPSWDAKGGLIHIVGGIPNGMYAKDARVVTLTLKALAIGISTLSLDTGSSGIFLNDGLGTKAYLSPVTMDLTAASDFTPTINVTSTSHPLAYQWSKISTVEISWDQGVGIQYSYAFGADGQAVPDDIPDNNVPILTYPNLADGRYSFTIKSRAAGGAWSAITQRWFLIDTTPPDPFTILQLAPKTVNGQKVIAWAANDPMSGAISTLRIDNQDIGTVTSPLTLKSAWRGKTLHITVTDLAGNSSEATWNYPALGIQWTIIWIIVGVIVMLSATIILIILVRRNK